MTDTPQADDSAAYWNRTHDRPRLRDTDPDQLRTTPQDDEWWNVHERDRRRSADPPHVRSGPDAFGEARRYVDAVLTLGFGIFCLVLAGSGGDRAFLVVLIGLVVIGYAGYIAFFAKSYEMPYYLYALAWLGGLAWLLYG